jgi:D-xylose transport system substrate-binding protein
MAGSVIGAAAMMILAGCGSSSTAATGNGRNCKKVGALLPDTASSARWATDDAPNLTNQIKAAIPGATVDVENAGGSNDVQLSQAEAMLTQGYCILIVAANDSTAAATIVEKAKAQNVPVIAYDRLIDDANLNYYVSFNNVAVGEAQGNWIKANYQSFVTANGNNNIAFINGSMTDNNALLFHQGVHEILDPLVTAGTLNKVYDQYTPNWDNPTAETEMQGVLSTTQNKLAVAYVANDGMATTVIAALKQQNLAGKVLVTGQDATVAGIQDILLGYQSMTVYKQIINEAKASAQLAAALSNGTSTATLTNGATTANSGTMTPSILLPVISVDKTNILSTVVADNYVTISAICQGVPSGTDGVCP